MNEKATPDRILSSSQDKKMVGWVLESPGRGTLSLITTCLFTIFLCTWAIIHPRVTRSPSRRISHKFAVFIKTILAPEFLAVESLQEWSQARKIVQQCEHLTDGELDLVQAFYIGMLALRYRAEHGQKVIWPNQYQWLLEQHLVDWKDHDSWGLSRENIRDKSNADTTVKLFAFVQVSWFVAQSIMRAAHDLPLSQLESMTLSYVPMFVVTYFFWWAKPKDVLTTSVVELPEMSLEQKVTFENMSVGSTFDDEHTKQQDSWWNIWKLTPRTFEKEARDKAFEEISRNTLSNAADEAERESHEDSKQQLDNERIDAKKASLKQSATKKPALRKSHTEIVSSATKRPSLRRNLTDIKPHVRRNPPEQSPAIDDPRPTTVQIADVSSLEPTFVGKAIRRATIGLRTTRSSGLTSSTQRRDRVLPQYPSETVLAYWDPHVYHSKIWPITCLFGASFGALHLMSWHTVFPTLVETWLWRVAAITSIVSMLIFMQFEKVVLR